jgi:abortive infection bacteriophage resistance protein
LGELEEAQDYIERMSPKEKEEMDLRSFLSKLHHSSQEQEAVTIRVIYQDNKKGEIDLFKLDKLIALGKIKKFFRSKVAYKLFGKVEGPDLELALS